MLGSQPSLGEDDTFEDVDYSTVKESSEDGSDDLSEGGEDSSEDEGGEAAEYGATEEEEKEKDNSAPNREPGVVISTPFS